MARSHSKLTVIKIGAVNISTFCNTSDFTRTAAASEGTGYGSNSKTYDGNLKDATFTCGGWYQTGAVGTPSVVFGGSEGTTFSITRQAEGAGVGKPQQVFSAVLTSFTESNPVGDFVQWTADFQCSGDIVSTAQ